jgi:N-acetyltransferase
VVGASLAALAVLVIVLTISAINDNSRANRLRNHGVPVSVTVTGCVAVASGTGETVYGYDCTGTFTVDGHTHSAAIRGNNGSHATGAVIEGVTDPSDPSILSTAAAVSKSHSSWAPFISPAVALVLLIAAVALTIWRIRRLQGRAAAVPGDSGSQVTAVSLPPATVGSPFTRTDRTSSEPGPAATPARDIVALSAPAAPACPASEPTGFAGLTPIVLQADRVRLEPLGPQHIVSLAAAASVDRSSYGYTWVPDGLEATEAYVAIAQAEWAAGRCLPFAVIDCRDGSLVGTTRIWDWAVLPSDVPPSDAQPPNVSEIGHTWYNHTAQGTGVNVEAKLLLLTHLFETWPGLRVTLKTDARNQRSFQAIERLGAHYEGTRRVHIPAADGTIRDSAYFSILASEWPAAKAQILSRLH